MRLAYLANIRLPTEKAHGVQIIKMCEVFAQAGAQVELVVPTRRNDLADDPYAYYGVQKNFLITYIDAPDTLAWPFGFYIQSWAFAFAAASYLRTKKFDLLFGREELPLWVVSLRLAAPVVWETHLGNYNFSARRLLRKAQKIVAISQGLKDFYAGRGVPAGKIVVAHDGVDLRQFENPQSKADARARLGLPQDKKVAMYIGRLDGWKGAATLLEASKLLPAGVKLAVVGGDDAQVAALSAQYQGVKFAGFRPYSELPDNQQAADVLVLPNTGKTAVSARYTSPLKLFSYMASGVPIVTSDLPSIREIVSEREAVLVKPDDPQALAKGIERALTDDSSRAQAAKELVKKYTWVSRAQEILKALTV
jgi:glycosyltransferase involved in cell wall biosynthesis